MWDEHGQGLLNNVQYDAYKHNVVYVPGTRGKKDWKTAYRVWEIMFDPQGLVFGGIDVLGDWGAGAAAAPQIGGGAFPGDTLRNMFIGGADDQVMAPLYLKVMTLITFKSIARYLGGLETRAELVDSVETDRLFGRAPLGSLHGFIFGGPANHRGEAFLTWSQIELIVKTWREIFGGIAESVGNAYGINRGIMIMGLYRYLWKWVPIMSGADPGGLVGAHALIGDDDALFNGFLNPIHGNALNKAAIHFNMSNSTLRNVLGYNVVNSRQVKMEVLRVMMQGM
jgi:hypothetical protein